MGRLAAVLRNRNVEIGLGVARYENLDFANSRSTRRNSAEPLLLRIGRTSDELRGFQRASKNLTWQDG